MVHPLGFSISICESVRRSLWKCRQTCCEDWSRPDYSRDRTHESISVKRMESTQKQDDAALRLLLCVCTCCFFSCILSDDAHLWLWTLFYVSAQQQTCRRIISRLGRAKSCFVAFSTNSSIDGRVHRPKVMALFVLWYKWPEPLWSFFFLIDANMRNRTHMHFSKQSSKQSPPGPLCSFPPGLSTKMYGVLWQLKPFISHQPGLSRMSHRYKWPELCLILTFYKS